MLKEKQFKDKQLILDTNILIYILQGNVDIIDMIDKAASRAVSTVTLAEVYAGSDKDGLEIVDEAVGMFTQLPVTSEIAKLAGLYKQVLPKLGLRDLIIAATAQTHNLTLVTADKSDFTGLLRKTPIVIDLSN